MTAIYRQSDSKDPDLRAHGCGAYAAINALHEVSGDDYNPDNATFAANYRVKRSGATDAEFRARGLTSDEVYRSLAAVVATDERMDVQLKRYQGQTVKEMLAKRAEVGGVLVIAVRYGAVQDAGKGIGSFRLGHWVCVFDQDGNDLTIADSLRRQTVTWPVHLLTKAAESFGDAPGPADNSWGQGRGEAILVYPWLTWRKGYSLLTTKSKATQALLSAAVKANGALALELAACKAQQPDAGLKTLQTKVKDWAGRLGDMEDEMDAAVAPV